MYNSMLAAERTFRKVPGKKNFQRGYASVPQWGRDCLSHSPLLKNAKEKPLKKSETWTEINKLRLCHWFTVDDLNHLKRGGRISGVTALVGTILDIKPVMHVDDEGHLINVGKARGRHAALSALVDHMKKTMWRIHRTRQSLSATATVMPMLKKWAIWQLSS